MEARSFRSVLTAEFVAAILILNVLASGGRTPAEISRFIPFACPTRLVTGWNCPTCGLGRGILAAATGEWRLAVAYHPLAIPILVACVLGLAALWIFPARLSAGWVRSRAFFRRQPAIVTASILVYTVWGFWRQVGIRLP